MRERPIDVVLIIFICLIWAGNYFVVKGVLAYVDPVTFALLRAALGGAFIFAIGGYAIGGITRRDLVWLLGLGFFNISVFLVLLNASLLSVNAGVDSTLIYTQPVLVAAISPLFGEILTRNRKVGIGAAFTGIVVIFLPSILASTLVAGDIFALGASCSWATAILIFKRWKPTININAATALQSMLGAMFILPGVVAGRPFVDPTLEFWAFLGYNVLLASGIGYLLYWRILSRMSAAQFTSYFFLVPVFATILASLFQLSFPPVNDLVGTLLVALGIVAVNR